MLGSTWVRPGLDLAFVSGCEAGEKAFYYFLNFLSIIGLNKFSSLSY